MGGPGSGVRRHSKSSAALPPPKSVPLVDDFVKCPGSDLIHPPCWLNVMKGPRILFVRCPMSKCSTEWQMRGFGYEERFKANGRIGLTRVEIAHLDPKALIL